MEITEQGRKAIASLRSAPESQRVMGTAVSVDGKMCACGFLAKPLGIDLYPEMDTVTLIRQIVKKTGIPEHLLDTVPGLNDAWENPVVGHYVTKPKYTLRDIANTFENLVRMSSG